MTWHRMKWDKYDSLFSKFIRERDSWTCVKCLKIYDPFSGASRQRLDNSHYFGRAMLTVRFDPENCDALCKMPCHRIWQTDDHDSYRHFKIKQLGMRGFNALTLRAKTRAPNKGGRYFSGQWLDKDMIYMVLLEEKKKWDWL